MTARAGGGGRLALAALLCAATVYFAVGLADLGVPGLEYDEAYDASIAVEFLNRQPLSAQSSIWLGGREWPIMTVEIEGPTSVYLSVAAFGLFGVSVPCLRITHLLVGFLTIVLLWVVARRWFDDHVAAIAVLLCATSPQFIWWFRAGGRWNASMLPIALAMALSLRRGWATGSPRALGVGAFLFGLGFTTKILFVWLVVPIALSIWLILGIEGTWRRLRRLSPSAFVAVAAGLGVGLLPFLIYNVRDGATFRFVAANALDNPLFEHNNLDLMHNLRQQVVEFARMMGGDTLVFGGRPGAPLAAIALACSVAYIAVRCVRRSTRPMSRREPGRLFLFVTVATVVPLSTISTSHIGATYLFVIVPFTWLLIAVSLRDGWHWLRRRTGRPGAGIIVTAVVGLLVFNHCLMNVRIVRFLERTGGGGLWSDAVFTLARRLEERYAGRPVVAMDWGLARNVAVLTQGRVRPIEAYEWQSRPSPAFDARCVQLLSDPANVYLFHVPQHTTFRGAWEAFARAADRAQRRLRLEEVLCERGGSPNVLVYSVSEG